ncbi:M20/M25/M40 family metallo-hydrolase [Erythrobacter sp. sf7]|uniref:M20/M25/M40 family metallo-hydrolase n=1 Tax=Erythrobacter fulvus TaxID=2987523 RepID=A0ABT5JL55_9SPHN|nr:M20/M25/M40 family metallo-hydrolase [Erythrobacter fulvus]MDC8753309.1 M20/M25/M40 family metallo-hydrolase [Erythrobacter fulvus]
MIKRLTLLAAIVAAPLAAQNHPADNVSQERLQADVETLVGFGTRHTLSAQDDPERGIGAAVNWALAEFKRIGAGCGDCLEVLPVGEVIQPDGRRIPTPTLVRNAVAIQRGTERPNEVVIVQGHIDSRVSDPLDFTSDAPGANDDGSGSALVLEAARALSATKYPSTIIYALLSGEEQGLFGGRILADWAEAQGFTVKAVLNNDIVGNSCGKDGYCEPKVVRVFSEGPRADLTERLRAAATRFGGENDTPSRNLSRWVAGLSEQHPDEMQVRQIWRTDRMGRGGDQVPFLQKGYPAIRFSVGVEDYDHQHQDLRTEDGVFYGDTIDEMDFGYLAGVTKLNVRALDALARAPMPPKVTVDAAVRVDTEIKWSAIPGAEVYAIAARRTDNPGWGGDVTLVSRNDAAAADGEAMSHVLKLRGDDWMFGVSACAGDYCSPVSSAVPGGAFEPVTKE